MNFDNEYCPFLESNFYNKEIICYWRKLSVNAIQVFDNERYLFSHTSEMNIVTILYKRHGTYNFLSQTQYACSWIKVKYDN